MKQRNFKTKLLKAGFIFSFFLLPFAFSASAHRFHTTLTRIDYNETDKIYEITIQMFAHDLIPTLERRTGKKFDFEKTADADKQIEKYLNENFVLTDKKSQAKILKWVGKEVETDSVRVYVETAATENPENYTLKNTLFFESFPEQSNLVVCHYDGAKADLLFKVGDKVKEIKPNETTEK